MNIRQRVASVLLGHVRALRWAMGWLALACGVGFVAADVSNLDYGPVDAAEPAWVLGALFILYGSDKLLESLCAVPLSARIAISAVGLWLWSYLFLLFVIFNGAPVRATELMLALPIITETWLFANALFIKHELKGLHRGA